MKRVRRTAMKSSLCITCILSVAKPSQSFLPALNTQSFSTRIKDESRLQQPQSSSFSSNANKDSNIHSTLYNNLDARSRSARSSRSSSASFSTKSSNGQRQSHQKMKNGSKRKNYRSNVALKETASSTTITTRKINSLPQNPNPNYMTNSDRAKKLLGKSSSAGAWYQRDEMMQHDILTKKDEVMLGSRVVEAKQIRDDMIELIEKRKLEEMKMDEMDLDENLGLIWEINDDGFRYGNVDGEDDNELGSLSVLNVQSDFDIDNELTDEEDDDYEFDSELIAIESRSRNGMNTNEEYIPNRYDGQAHFDFRGDRRISSTLVQDGSKLMTSSIDADLNLLSEDDIQNVLNIQGGKIELRRILYNGARARNKLMRSNIRLVVSIGKKWMGRNKDNGGIADKYNGSWDRPSLDEVIQEGMLGLARAVDKYDPDRGLRFSTYSTHWITSYVRQCFQASATGCLKVPSQLHDIKTSYKSIVKRYIEASEGIPSEEQIAAEIGVSLARLRTAIRVTESLLSIDEPVYMGGNAAFKGSGAGGDLSGENSLLVSDRLECSEIAPEDYVENGFLRQTLENAMASELSPYERDILRLRLGLDDGQIRTVKQVVEECGGDVSIAEVRSAERRAFKKLRSPNAVHAHNLVAYLDMADIDLNSFDNRRW